MSQEVRKPQRLENFASGKQMVDSLHYKSEEGFCTKHVCKGSIMFNERRGSTPKPTSQVLQEAKDFLKEYYQSIHRLDGDEHRRRWDRVRSEVESTGTYDLTYEELSFGAKLAWRNAPRCIGRMQWSKLQVFDARTVKTAKQMFDAICTHIKYGTNGGNIRSAITVFPQRTDGNHDFRVWNQQLIMYAGYQNEDGSITGDPICVEFTQLCQKLGWKGRGKKWDILPMVLSANGQDPEWFEIPKGLIKEVEITHPRFKWFKELDLRWYVLPAVSNMLFDCGGLEFTAAPFNGWYMSSEIGTRDLSDPHRFNILEDVATRMGLDVRTNTSLWKDKALVEVNHAVISSFNENKITIMDHHSAAESFMKHLENEQRLRGGCPADWTWIVPPLSGSITPVFHQEMFLYYLKPSYEYQEFAWVAHARKNGTDRKNRWRLTLKNVARAVVFACSFYCKVLAKRVKATIVYATETGKSQTFASLLGDMFSHAFNVQVLNMDVYSHEKLASEDLLLVVTSTFGNGDPPENGQQFCKNLQNMNNISQVLENKSSFVRCQEQKTSERRRISGLKNVRYAVFALGSKSYPNFCAFGKYVNSLLGDLGGRRLVDVAFGDELDGQEQSFKVWASDVFKTACTAFNVHDSAEVRRATAALTDDVFTEEQLRLQPLSSPQHVTLGLLKAFGTTAASCEVLVSESLHPVKDDLSTQLVVLSTEGRPELEYSPGDHLAVFSRNHHDLVSQILSSISSDDPDTPVQLQTLVPRVTINGTISSWEPDRRLPAASVRDLLSRYLDITTPPPPSFLQMLSSYTDDPDERTYLKQLATNGMEYQEWKEKHYPNMAEVLNMFPNVTLPVTLLLKQLPLLKPRFYSISSSPVAQQGQLHITVSVVKYRTQGGKGPTHYGVCSNYLQKLQKGDRVECYVRSAHSFHMPSCSRPIILVAAGTGIAPFRSFWQHRSIVRQREGCHGAMRLFFGCRKKEFDLYGAEKEKMRRTGVLSNVHLALSRETSVPKTYVQDQMEMFAEEVFQQVVVEHGHVYVCGDCTMAEGVQQTLKKIIKEKGKMTDNQVEYFIVEMKKDNRYHEDVFGAIHTNREISWQQKERNRKDTSTIL